MDGADEALKRRKAKEESHSDAARNMHNEKKVDWDHWFGILKGGDSGAKEMNKKIMEERAKISSDIEERIKKIQRQRNNAHS